MTGAAGEARRGNERVGGGVSYTHRLCEEREARELVDEAVKILAPQIQHLWIECVCVCVQYISLGASAYHEGVSPSVPSSRPGRASL